MLCKLSYHSCPMTEQIVPPYLGTCERFIPFCASSTSIVVTVTDPLEKHQHRIHSHLQVAEKLIQ